MTKVESIAKKAISSPMERFNALMHHFSIANLKDCYHCLDARKAVGIDGITKEDFGVDLKANLEKLYEELKSFSYRPQPVLRVEIPKADGSTRPLGISCIRDKIVQEMMRRVLESIYEPQFIESSYGFRPGKSCHDALRRVNSEVMGKPTNFLVDLDISKFFDSMPHSDVLKLFEIKIKDKKFLRLLVRMLKAGVYSPNGTVYEEMGSPQGSVVSPAIANVFLHYVLDLWFIHIVKRHVKGYCAIVRYADDACAFFQRKDDLEMFLRVLPKRLNKFGLKLNIDKTSVVTVGYCQVKKIKSEGKKPDTFDFLGFTHYWGYSKKGKLRLKYKTSKVRLRKAIIHLNQWMKERRNLYKLPNLWRIVCSKIRGHINYFGVTDNQPSVRNFRHKAIRILFYWLNRRSQRKSFNWVSFNKYLKKFPIPRMTRTISLLPDLRMIR